MYRIFMQFGASGRNIAPVLYRSEVVMAAITRFAARQDGRSPFGPAMISAECGSDNPFFLSGKTVDGDYGAITHFTTPTNTAANCFGRSMCA